MLLRTAAAAAAACKGMPSGASCSPTFPCATLSSSSHIFRVFFNASSFIGHGCASSLVTSRRCSQVSNFKVPGYFRLQARDIVVPESAYELRMSRGSGPGGQGANCSSNKVELRLRLIDMLDTLDDDTYTNLVRQQTDKALTSDGELLIVSSHDHRSALKNKESCIAMIKEMIVKASWVPPVEADPIETSTSTINRHKVERRKKGMVMKMRSSVRQGKW